MKRILQLGACSALLLICLSIALPPGASAADATNGDVIVVPLGKKGSGLRVKGIKLSAISPAKVSGSKLTLPVADVTLPRSVRVNWS